MSCCGKRSHVDVGEVYLHIGNGGVRFGVADRGHGPQIEIISTHLGNNVNRQEILVSPNELIALARLFDHAAKHESYSETYCQAALVESSTPQSLAAEFIPERGGCGSCCCEG